jgi:ABC-type dipeptide/oligopeptide/nickel transport system ATPase component
MTEAPTPLAFPYGEHITLIGATGSGKTMLAKWGMLPLRNRFIIIDSKARADGTSIDFQEKAFVTCDVKKAVHFAAGDKNFRLRIPMPSGEEGHELVEELAHGLLYKNGHDCLLYLDEVTDFSDAWQIGEQLEGLIRKARGYRISVGVGSQKPKGLSGWFVDNSAHLIILGMKQAEVSRFTQRTGAEWIAEVQPSIPIGSFRFAHEDFKGNVTVWNPVPEFDWSRVE